MPFEFSPECRELLAGQADAISRSQGIATGLESGILQNRLRGGRWQQLQRGVYTPFTGQPARETQLWAALLRAGPGATLSHDTAAERHGLLDQPSTAIHITVPAERNPARYGRIPGVIIHRSPSISDRRHPAMTPPCTKVEDTVLDLIEASADFDRAYQWICRAIGRRRTTADRIRAALDARERFRWRRDIELALNDAKAGALSGLELRYVRGVECAHRLPAAERQTLVSQASGNKYLDNLYVAYGVCVEVDGTAAHPADQQWRDKRRDNWNLVREKIVTLRFGYLDLRTQSIRCETAAEVAALLSDRGPAAGTSCRRAACPLGRR